MTEIENKLEGEQFGAARLRWADGNSGPSNMLGDWQYTRGGEAETRPIAESCAGKANRPPDTEPMADFPAVISLASLNGSNGFRLVGIAGERAGYSVASAGDVNGDGFDDLIIGAPSAPSEDGDSLVGQSHVVFGKAGGFSASLDYSSLNGANGFNVNGIDEEGIVIDDDDSSGFSVASAGDINGDGFDDLIIGAPNYGEGDDFNLETGMISVVFGKAGGFSASLDLANNSGANGFNFVGLEERDELGFSVASAGDFNGDGFDDFIAGAPRSDQGGYGAGLAGLVFGTAGGVPANGIFFVGIDNYDYSGQSVASAGDVNGDGFDDLIIGAFRADSQAGESYVVFGRAGSSNTSVNLTGLNGRNGFRLDGIDAGDSGGHSVASAGDINGDGFDDVIIGAYGGDPGGDFNAGESYVVFGNAGGFAASLDLSTLDGTNGFRLEGLDAFDQSGRSVASAGDVNGDGFSDIIVGTLFVSESYVVFGRAPTTAVDRVGAGGDQTIRGGDFNDTLSGRAGDDTLIGGEGRDRLAGGAGIDRFLLDGDEAGNADTIVDFAGGQEKILLAGDVYGLPEGQLAAGSFAIGGQAGDSDDRIIYNDANGKLFFDADGAGTEAQVLIATLKGAPTIDAGDFEVLGGGGAARSADAAPLLAAAPASTGLERAFGQDDQTGAVPMGGVGGNVADMLEWMVIA